MVNFQSFLCFRDSQLIKAIPGMEGFQFFEDKESDAQACGMYNSQVIIIAYRGTESFTDMLVNLNFMLVRYS